jgi:hypothetical protein
MVDIKTLENMLNEGKLVELGKLIREGQRDRNVINFLNKKYEDLRISPRNLLNYHLTKS